MPTLKSAPKPKTQAPKPKATKESKTKPKATKTEKAPRARKEGLRAWQVRILKALSKLPPNAAIGRKRISELAKVHPSNQTNAWGIGCVDPSKRKEVEAKSGIPSLLTLGFVREKMVDVDGKEERCYQITASGKQALAKAEKA